MVKREGLGKATIYIPRELITKNDGCEFAHLIALPVLELVVTDVNKILLE